LNTYESELIKKAATEAGLEEAVIFNSCAVTAEAERQLRQAIRKTKRQHPHKKIIVTGCAAQISPKKYADMVEVDQILGNAIILYLKMKV
jgi:threonylcarbamoyladenosine tRNA methylthiotransferase MtaB